MKVHCGATYVKRTFQPPKSFSQAELDKKAKFAVVLVELLKLKFRFVFIDEYSTQVTVGKNYAWKTPLVYKYAQR